MTINVLSFTASLALALCLATPADRTGPRITLVRAIPEPGRRADVATSLALVDHGALIVGWTSQPGHDSDGLLLRVNDQGDVRWRRELGGPGEDIVWRVLRDGDAFVCVGFTSKAGAGKLDGWMFKLDAQGETLWERTFGTAGDEWLTSFEATADGWIAVGQTDGRGAGGLDAFVVRVDREGRELASWTSGSPAYERAFGITPLADGGCVIAGMAGADKESCDAFVQRFGPDGKSVWNKVFERAGFGVAHDVHVRADGTLAVYGYCFVDTARDCDAFVAHVSAKGEVLGQDTFGSEDNDRALHARFLGDGAAVFVGHSQRKGATNGEEGWDLAVYLLDRESRPLWSGRFGGEGTEFGRGIAGTANDLWIVGHSTQANGEESNVLLIRMDASGVVG